MGVPYFGGPFRKDPTIMGTILGSPLFGNSPMRRTLKGLGFEDMWGLRFCL